MQWIKPDWPAPADVKAISTTRVGGSSQAPYDSLNLGTHVGDEQQNVLANRKELKDKLQLPSEPLWLEQVHSTVIANADDANPQLKADASFSCQQGNVCIVMTADCLPVLMTNKSGTVIAAAHAGWRGLNDGILEATITKMRAANQDASQNIDQNANQSKDDDIIAWLGPAIGPEHFEVGEEVRETFVTQHEASEQAFVKGEGNGKWLADIYLLARIRLRAMGVEDIYGGGLCTYKDQERFFSYRREATTGRMASLIWLDA